MTPEADTSLRRYALWGALALGAIILIAILLYALTPAKPAPRPQPSPSLPVSGTSGGSTSTAAGNTAYSVPISSGVSIATRDFLHDPATVADQSNRGYYYIGYHQSTGPQDTTATANPPYVIEYIAQTHYFNIGLYQEPIGQVRRAAEQYLLNTLGISSDEACTLKYMVSVPDKVNSVYSGENLGFSFCPGAVQLPE